MKKLIAILLSVVVVFSMSAIAFAAEPATYKDGEKTYIICSCGRMYDKVEDYNDCMAKHASEKEAANAPTTAPSASSWKCEYCPKMFTDITEYNDHLVEYHEAETPKQQNMENRVQYYYDKYIGETVQDILNDMIDLFQKSGIMDFVKVMVEDIWARVMAFIDNNIGSEADVAGSIDDLENKVFSLNLDNDLLSAIKSIINELKQKIKDLYCGERATVAEVTEAAAPANTGSSSAAIAVFAAVSAAAAAAYVCTKKRA